VSEDQPRRRVVTQRMIEEAILDLYDAQRVITRQTICELTGFRMAIVDEHVEKLIDKGRLRRVANGVFEPIDVSPEARAISATVLPDGRTKLEVGDDMMMFTPHECRLAALLLGGHFNSYHSHTLAREFNSIATHNDTLIKEIRRQQARMEQRLDAVLAQQQNLPLMEHNG